MKRFFLTAVTTLFVFSIAIAQPLPSKWKLTKYSHTSFEELQEANSSRISATECGEGYIEAPVREGMKNGDCWIFHFPVQNLKAKTYFEFDIELGVRQDRPQYFAIEYKDGKDWKLKETVKCVGGQSEPRTVIETILLEKPIRKGEVMVRVRAIGDENPDTWNKLMPYGYIGGYANVLGTKAPSDTVRVGYLGNSFTFVNAADFILKEIAWNEGHYLDMNVNTYPGAYFRSHLGLTGSLDVISGGGYDWFILQDQSTQAAKYGRDSTAGIMDYAKTISKVIRYFSPDTRIVLEQTWAFSKDNYGSFGSFEFFDECSSRGAGKIAAAIDAKVSPIAAAFAIVREERPDIEIYSTDFHHPAAYGAYLKACVNYLVIFGTAFSSENANFALDPQICSYLRKVAERVVL